MAGGQSEDLVREFREKRQRYENLEQRLKSLIDELIRTEHIRIHTIESRTKTEESFQEKISRPGKQYDSLDQIIDLCGLRVIVYYKSDVGRVSELLHREFDINPDRSGDTVDRLAPDQFGYASLHHVLRLSASRENLREYKDSRGIWAEVQVRTAVQHAWAAISHALQYKRETDLPKPLIRRLARLAGLLELADEEFESVRKQHEIIATNATEAVKSGRLALALDATSIQGYVMLSSRVPPMRAAVKRAGFQISRVTKNETTSQLIRLARLLGIRTLEDFDAALARIEPVQQAYFETLRSGNPRTWTASESFFMMLILPLAFQQEVTAAMLMRIFQEFGWHDDIANRVAIAATQFRR
jgi:ppGpp synthetase/RelA/SpoT-type nucleotidyltranferase